MRVFFLSFKCVMEPGFLTFILVSSCAVHSSHIDITDWDDVMVAREGSATTLTCRDTGVTGAVEINWLVKSPDVDEWKLLLTASQHKTFSGGASKASMRLLDPNFQDTGVFSLSFLPSVGDSGLYSCLIKQQERKLKEKIILLAILKVHVVPTAPIPQHSTLRLIARVIPDSAITRITWTAPGGISMKSEKKPNTGTVAKLPQVQNSDSGAYVCLVQPWGNSSSSVFAFNVDVTVDADKVASFTNITHAPSISTATQTEKTLPLTCPSVQGDYVLLYWLPPDIRRQKNMRLVYQYDRWRGSTVLTEQSKRLQLAGPPYNADAGSFSFLLTPGLKDGGLYICEVSLNDNIFSQRTLLSVLKVKTSHYPSKLELGCLYSEQSQVQSVNWKHQNKSRQLQLLSNGPGSITTVLPLPITSDITGNYTCTLLLKNGQVIWATQAVTLPHKGIEQSLSVQSGEAENIYENPEDIRQAPPQGSVYMDLKPRGEDDVYKELERYEQCQS
ncbi:g6f-like isoform X2 [Parambassis ranga]|uniref:G6f-like isoform X2 n=1 Tax=Parambassis ranga TaxID=210632 RepID=A0A6P7JTM0_9TELE|nr:uncharacterized protein LOC114447908 isoform X2 [Parambassis ranga]